MAEIELVDAASLALLGVAALRGFFRGAMREAFTLAAVAAAFICVCAFIDIVIACILLVPNGVQQTVAAFISGAVLAAIPWWLVDMLGRNLQQDTHPRSMGIRDLLLGFFLGMARGGLLWAIFMTMAVRAPMFTKLPKNSWSLAFYEAFISNG